MAKTSTDFLGDAAIQQWLSKLSNSGGVNDQSYYNPFAGEDIRDNTVRQRVFGAMQKDGTLQTILDSITNRDGSAKVDASKAGYGDQFTQLDTRGGQDWLTPVLMIGGFGAGLAAGAGSAGVGSGAMSGDSIAASVGAETTAGGSGAYGALTDAPWGVNPQPTGGAFDMGGSAGVFDSAGNPLYNTSAGSTFYQTLTSIGVPPGAAASVTDALGKGIGLREALQVAGIGATLAGAVMGSSAAKQAAQVQAESANTAIAEQRRQFDVTRADNAPFLKTGTNANARLGQLLGTNPADGSVPSDGMAEGGYGSLLRRFGVEDLNRDPVYQSGLQFGLDEGTKGINARAVAGGNYDSGATLKALTRFGNDYGSTKANDSYNRYTADNTNIYNRLAGVSGGGQTAVAQNAATGANTTNAITELTTGAGNARAAGIVGGANAWGQAAGGLNTAANNYGNSQILEALLKSRGVSI